MVKFKDYLAVGSLIIGLAGSSLSLKKIKDSSLENFVKINRYCQLEEEISKPREGRMYSDKSSLDSLKQLYIEKCNIEKSRNFYLSKQIYDTLSESKSNWEKAYAGFATLLAFGAAYSGKKKE